MNAYRRATGKLTGLLRPHIAVIILLFFAVFPSWAGASWRLLGPGDADQATSLSILRDGTLYLGTDIGGLYRSTDQGESWEPANAGLRNYDISTNVVQDLSDPGILHVGTRGGYYRSTDGGRSWANIRAGLPPETQGKLSASIGGLAPDPFDHRTLYLAPGYRPSSDGTVTVRKIAWTGDIYRSTDKGTSWRKVGKLPDGSKVYQLMHSPTERGVLYAAASSGLYASKTAGKTWTRIFDKETLNLLLFADSPKTIVAACGRDGVYVSTNAGAGWTASNAGLDFNAHRSGPDRYSVLAADPKEKNRWYVLNSTWGRGGGLYVTDDGGGRWRLLTADLPESWLKTSRRVNTLAIRPDRPQTLFLGSSRYAYRSDDGGRSWEQLISRRVGKGWAHRGLNVFGHTREVAIDPDNPDHMYIATADHGIVKSEDRGQSWFPVSAGLRYGDSVWDIDMCPTGRKGIYVASSTSGGESCVSVSHDKGASWQALCGGLDKKIMINKILVKPEDCRTVYLATGKGLLKSVDGGMQWAPSSGLPEVPVHALAFDPRRSDIVYAGTQTGLYKSENAGSTWVKTGPRENLLVWSILVSARDPATILLGTEVKGENRGALYRSNDGGRTWTSVLRVSKLVSGLAQMPNDTNTIYAASNDHNYRDDSGGSGIFRSRDHGLTWESVNHGLPVMRAWNITTDRARPDEVFLSSNGSGAYVLSQDARQEDRTRR